MSTINTASTGVFDSLDVNGGLLRIPLTSIKYGDATITEAEATGDYRALLRGIHESFNLFMTGTATGTTNPDGFNKPEYFKEDESSYTMFDADTTTRRYTTTFYYKVLSDSPLEPED